MAHRALRKEGGTADTYMGIVGKDRGASVKFIITRRAAALRELLWCVAKASISGRGNLGKGGLL
jgi:hypothetical protein